MFFVFVIYFWLVQLKGKEKGEIEQIYGRQWKFEVCFGCFKYEMSVSGRYGCGV